MFLKNCGFTFAELSTADECTAHGPLAVGNSQKAGCESEELYIIPERKLLQRNLS